MSHVIQRITRGVSSDLSDTDTSIRPIPLSFEYTPMSACQYPRNTQPAESANSASPAMDLKSKVRVRFSSPDAETRAIMPDDSTMNAATIDTINAQHNISKSTEPAFTQGAPLLVTQPPSSEKYSFVCFVCCRMKCF